MSNETEKRISKAPGAREKAFIVQSVDFRCMAYRDSKGKWRDYFDGEEIPGEVTVVAEG